MALNLDQRQRAMLQEMGITVWLPSPAEPYTAAAEPPTSRAAAAQPAAAPAAPAPARSVPASASFATSLSTSLPASAAAPAAAKPIAAKTTAAPTQAAIDLRSWRLHASKPVYTAAEAAASDGGWLILLEQTASQGLSSPTARTPSAASTALEGDAAQLLDNMLRALGLQHQPHVWSAALERDTTQTHAPLTESLATMVQELRPARILVLGLAAARAVLGRSDALGRLRSEPHQVAGLPTVVTYDPNYLLRAAHAKPAAWADLCRAKNMGRFERL